MAELPSFHENQLWVCPQCKKPQRKYNEIICSECNVDGKVPLMTEAEARAKRTPKEASKFCYCGKPRESLSPRKTLCLECAKLKHAEEQSRYRRKIQDEQESKAELRKNKVLDHYGRKCACCGCEDVWTLQIDHVNNDGARRRAEGEPVGSMFMEWIIDHDYPDDLQLLCANCNLGKAHNWGVCPHKTGNKKLTPAEIMMEITKKELARSPYEECQKVVREAEFTGWRDGKVVFRTIASDAASGGQGS